VAPATTIRRTLIGLGAYADDIGNFPRSGSPVKIHTLTQSPNDTTTRITSCVPVSSAGIQAMGSSNYASISSNGRYVAFESDADNLIDGTTLSGIRHIFMAPVL